METILHGKSNLMAGASMADLMSEMGKGKRTAKISCLPADNFTNERHYHVFACWFACWFKPA
jgi:hypothetical protein